MHCPQLKELPEPPAGTSGWPWTEEAHQDEFPEARVNLPLISIITPSFQQGRFIEETIRSVLLQGYPFLDYIIIDGGSTDGSWEVIEKYGRWLSYRVHEKDRGQSDAINKGFAKAVGVIGNWLNSDDILLPGALWRIGLAYTKNDHCIVCGDAVYSNEVSGQETYQKQKGVDLERVLCYWRNLSFWIQPAIYYPIRLFRETGGLDVDLHFVMDYDLFCRMLQGAKVVAIDDAVMKFRYHKDSKTVSIFYGTWLERIKVYQRYKNSLAHVPDAEEVKMAYCKGCVDLMHKCLKKRMWKGFIILGWSSLVHGPILTFRYLGLKLREGLKRKAQAVRNDG